MKRFRVAALCVCLLATVSSLTAAVAELKLEPQQFNDHVDGYIQNPAFMEITVTFNLALTNATSSLAPPYTLILPGNKKTKVFTVTQTKKLLPWSYSAAYTWMPGNAAAVHDNRVIYRLPYPAGSSFKVGQGYQGKFSHSQDTSYAIDWNMPEGSPVCAAREGLVVDVQISFNQGGTNKAKFSSMANYIYIQHSDHTIGEYVHLKQNGALVKPGQQVKAGDPIGWSGNTGFTSGPHLHFMVFKPVNARQRQSIPVHFRAVEGASLTLQEGKTYTAP